MIGLERAVHPDADVVGLLLGQLGELHAERIEVQGRHVVALDDGNAYLAAGVAGMGVLWLPQYMANDHAARGELVPLFDGWSFDAMPMYVAFPSNRHVSAKLRAFIDWAAELIAGIS